MIAWLEAQPRAYDQRDALLRVQRARLEVFDGIVDGMRALKRILAPEQIRALPPAILVAFDDRTLRMARPSLAFFPLF